jgi:hypothetical protein
LNILQVCISGGSNYIISSPYIERERRREGEKKIGREREEERERRREGEKKRGRMRERMRERKRGREGERREGERERERGEREREREERERGGDRERKNNMQRNTSHYPLLHNCTDMQCKLFIMIKSNQVIK